MAPAQRYANNHAQLLDVAERSVKSRNGDPQAKEVLSILTEHYREDREAADKLARHSGAAIRSIRHRPPGHGAVALRLPDGRQPACPKTSTFSTRRPARR